MTGSDNVIILRSHDVVEVASLQVIKDCKQLLYTQGSPHWFITLATKTNYKGKNKNLDN